MLINLCNSFYGEIDVIYGGRPVVIVFCLLLQSDDPVDYTCTLGKCFSTGKVNTFPVVKIVDFLLCPEQQQQRLILRYVTWLKIKLN